MIGPSEATAYAATSTTEAIRGREVALRLQNVEVRNYRSIFVPGGGSPFSMPVQPGMNILVGPNNCGKSNVLRAIAVALDPQYPFDRVWDLPGGSPLAKPSVTLTFEVVNPSSPEKTLLNRLAQYENQVRQKSGGSYSDEGVVKYRAVIEGTERSAGTRRSFFLARGTGVRTLKSDDDLLVKAVKQFHECVRFVLLESGESLQSMLEGRFRQILLKVVNEHLQSEYQLAVKSRQEYSAALQDTLLAPLVARIQDETSEIFPEVVSASLEPAIPDLDETLSKATVRIKDAIETNLGRKGTGVRAGVIVAMLHYLAENSRRSLVCAVEEPESFLHPAAQETLREDLEKLSSRPDINLLVTTHSPFLVSRRPDSQVVAIAKDPSGTTYLDKVAVGAESKSRLLGNLFRDPGIPDLLERAGEIPSTARGVLLVEGWTDQQYLLAAVEASDRQDLLEDLHIVVGGGTTRLIAQVILVRERVKPRPIVVLLDNDGPGRNLAKKLINDFGLQNRREIVHYSCVFGSNDFEYEAEDLLPPSLIERFIKERGEDRVVDGKKRRPDKQWHWDLSQKAKGELAEAVRTELKARDVHLWIKLVEDIRKVMKLESAEPTPI